MRKPLLVILSVSSAILVAVAVVLWCFLAGERRAPRAFPEGFMFGVASSSYQIEGAWNEDGKSESIWDHLVHSKPCVIVDCSNGDIAADSYHLYKRDVEMLRELGVDFYRFSLSWPRLLPTGLPSQVNTAAVDYYNNYINEMIKYNITPVVTLFHWDLPQKLAEMGGWRNPHATDWFAGYARTAFQLFGDRVKYWITINEPEVFCFFAYSHKTKLLESNEKLTRGVTSHECPKIMLMAHAKVWHIYDKEYRALQAGNISIAISSMWFEPENVNNMDDVQAAEDIYHANFGYYVDPIFSKSSEYPTKPAREFAIARLPDFTEQEKAFLRGTSDYFGLNHYTTKYIYRKETSRAHNITPRYFKDVDVWIYDLPEGNIGTSHIIKYAPWGFHKMLNRIRQDYDNPPVFIFENGFATSPGLQDDARITYLHGYMAAMLDAIEEGSDIRGYTVWSLMDSFEWRNGYRERFGLYEISHSADDPLRARRPRASAQFYRRTVRARALSPAARPAPHYAH